MQPPRRSRQVGRCVDGKHRELGLGAGSDLIIGLDRKRREQLGECCVRWHGHVQRRDDVDQDGERRVQSSWRR
jgi:hypothetical protein